MIDLLSQTRSETAEADHLQAVARLKTMQRRRGLIVWITEMVDSVGRPELVIAASELVRHHLVVLVLLKHPELEALAARTPVNADEMFHSRRRAGDARAPPRNHGPARRQGVLIVETTAAEWASRHQQVPGSQSRRSALASPRAEAECRGARTLTLSSFAICDCTLTLSSFAAATALLPCHPRGL